MSNQNQMNNLNYYTIFFNSGRTMTVPVEGKLEDVDIFKASDLLINGAHFNTQLIEAVVPAPPPQDVSGVVTPLRPAEKKLRERLKEEREMKQPENTLSRVKSVYKKAEEEGKTL